MVGMAIFALGVASGVYLAVVIDWITLSRARRRGRGPAGRSTYPLSAVRLVRTGSGDDAGALAEIVPLRRRGAPESPLSGRLYDWEAEQEQG